MRFLFLIVFVLGSLCLSDLAFAGGERVQGRLFAGRLFSQPDDFNTQMSSIGLTDFGTIDKVGFEATYGLFDRFEIGLRFANNSASNVSKTNPSTSDWSRRVAIHQGLLQVVGRVPVLKTSFFRADVFGAYGMANTDIDVASASQNGTLSHSGFSHSLVGVTSYGASAGIGFKGVYLFMEAGKEVNKIDSFDRTGTVSSNLNSIDLSGPYFVAGILADASMMDGIITKLK